MYPQYYIDYNGFDPHQKTDRSLRFYADISPSVILSILKECGLAYRLDSADWEFLDRYLYSFPKNYPFPTSTDKNSVVFHRYNATDSFHESFIPREILDRTNTHLKSLFGAAFTYVSNDTYSAISQEKVGIHTAFISYVCMTLTIIAEFRDHYYLLDFTVGMIRLLSSCGIKMRPETFIKCRNLVHKPLKGRIDIQKLLPQKYYKATFTNYTGHTDAKPQWWLNEYPRSALDSLASLLSINSSIEQCVGIILGSGAYYQSTWLVNNIDEAMKTKIEWDYIRLSNRRTNESS